jgi:hypothetical protein
MTAQGQLAPILTETSPDPGTFLADLQSHTMVFQVLTQGKLGQQ